MTVETLKSPNPRKRNGISVIKSKFLSVCSMNTLLVILKVTDARRDVILAGGLYHRFLWRHLPAPLLHFIGKRPKHRFCQFLFSSFLSTAPDQPLISCWRSSPHHNQLFHNDVLFHDARILIKVDLHFWNEMPDYFTLLEQAKRSL